MCMAWLALGLAVVAVGVSVWGLLDSFNEGLTT
jgi:hypothetical protein